MIMLWCCHHGTATARVYPVHLMNAKQRHVDHANLLGWKADTRFTVP